MSFDQIRAQILTAMGLAALTGCIGGKDTVSLDSGTAADSGSSTDDSAEPERTCADVDILTAEVAETLSYDETATWLVCVDKDGECPATDELSGWEVLSEALGPHPEPDFCGWYGDFVCGPEAAITDQCCYEMTVGQVCEGRPLAIDGEWRRAEIRRGSAWLSEVRPDLSRLSVAERRLQARQWLSAAQDEHASVAAFHRFSLQLMALGAPPELLLETQRAAADEVLHARLSFGLASAFAGSPMSAGPIDTAGALETDLAAILRAHVQEACINETVACVQAAAARDEATDPAVRAVLERIVEDETRHAALAWKTLRWLLSLDGNLVDIVREELDAAHFEGARAEALERVVRPCAEALLEAVGCPDEVRILRG